MTIKLTRDELMTLVLFSEQMANKYLGEVHKKDGAKAYRAWSALHKKLNDQLVAHDDKAAMNLAWRDIE